jgi:mono/diheme cytochrome c family protein
MQNRSRVLTFRLGGQNELPQLPAAVVHREPAVTSPVGSDEQIATGHAVYVKRCLACHGFSVISGGLVKDLRLSEETVHAQWNAIVLGGLLQGPGMPAFAGILTAEEAEAVRMYVLDRARALADSAKTPFSGM